MVATALLPVIGKMAPDFTLPSTEGPISLRQYKGKKTVILYFYPKDDTPGCTREACDFRDHLAEFDSSQVVILGVSTWLLMEAVAPEALVPPQLVGMAFSFLGMVAGSLYGRQTPQPHAAHPRGH